MYPEGTKKTAPETKPEYLKLQISHSVWEDQVAPHGGTVSIVAPFTVGGFWDGHPKKKAIKNQKPKPSKKACQEAPDSAPTPAELRSPPSLPLVSLGSGQSRGCAAAIAVLVAGDPAGQPSQQRFQKNSGEATARR